jgi:hypothetical protein
MSNLTVSQVLKPETVERVILGGDLARLTSSEKLDYYSKVCQSLGLNPLTQPFAYIKLNGKEVLYAKRDCTDQLRRVHGVSIKITSRESIAGVYVVTAQATMGDRCDESTGAVTIENLKGDNLANAFLKAETKAKRRVTLSICGLGLLDETEVDSIPEVKEAREATPQTQAAQVQAASTAPPNSDDPGDYVVRAGKKYAGAKLRDIPADDISSFMKWIREKADAKFRDSDAAKEFLFFADIYLKQPRSQAAADLGFDESWVSDSFDSAYPEPR